MIPSINQIAAIIDEMETPRQKREEKTRKINRLRQQAIKEGIRSPYRQSVYIKKHLK